MFAKLNMFLFWFSVFLIPSRPQAANSSIMKLRVTSGDKVTTFIITKQSDSSTFKLERQDYRSKIKTSTLSQSDIEYILKLSEKSYDRQDRISCPRSFAALDIDYKASKNQVFECTNSSTSNHQLTRVANLLNLKIDLSGK